MSIFVFFVSAGVSLILGCFFSVSIFKKGLFIGEEIQEKMMNSFIYYIFYFKPLYEKFKVLIQFFGSDYRY